jgi:CheY-specific phosphatase CheX
MDQDVDVRRSLEEVSAAACEALFRRYGVAVRRAGENEEPISPAFFLCSVIGFTGRDIRGALVLAVTEDLSGLSNPVAGNDRAVQRDWVGELSNQLLGHIKMELLRRGVEIHINLPAVMLGQHLAPLPRARLKPLKFTVANCAAALWIEIEARPDFKIEPAATTPAEPCPAPGDALLFD